MGAEVIYKLNLKGLKNMSKIVDKLSELFLGGEDEFDEYEEEEVTPKQSRFAPKSEPDAPKQPLLGKKNNSSNSRVVNIHATTQLEVAVLQPQSYEDSREIADRLKNKKAVVINLEELSKEDAIKVLDFVSGVVYALEGDIQKVSSGIFLIAPYNVSIASDVRDELKSTGIFPWSY